MQHMGEVESGDFTGRIPVTGNDELSDLTERFNQMSAELDTYTKQVYLSKIKQTEAELNALKSQIYPHFLYNSFQSVPILTFIIFPTGIIIPNEVCIVYYIL